MHSDRQGVQHSPHTPHGRPFQHLRPWINNNNNNKKIAPLFLTQPLGHTFEREGVGYFVIMTFSLINVLILGPFWFGYGNAHDNKLFLKNNDNLINLFNYDLVNFWYECNIFIVSHMIHTWYFHYVL